MNKFYGAFLNEHMRITIGIMVSTLPLIFINGSYGVHWAMFFLLSGFWLGREHAQADQRYLEKHRIKWKDKPFFAGFYKESWNYKSLFEDMLYPILMAFVICIFLEILG
jgi:hypothetical protein